MPWRFGEIILARSVHRGRVVQAAPVRVVADRPDLLVTWIAPGTPVVYPAGQGDNGRLLPLPRWRIDHRPQAVELGLLSADDPRPARGEAERVLAEWPFPTGWEDWRPDPGWELPELPAGWDVLER